jgi:alcohol dehydrogenase class IV
MVRLALQHRITDLDGVDAFRARVDAEPVNGEHQAKVAAAMGHPREAAADVVSAFIGELGLPRRLAEVDVKHERFGGIAEHVMHDDGCT